MKNILKNNNFLKIKKIILIYFTIKNILKNNYYYIFKYTLNKLSKHILMSIGR
jgi:hypothetical protein